jgi:8-oxo-dGTP pyrophosphatase MutT (NUDIX family)
MTVTGFAINDGLCGKIAERLGGFARRAIVAPGLKAAAVVIVVTSRPGDDTAAILVTLRSRRLGRHGGQFALPGGRVDAGETDIAAALRELDEELGVKLDTHQVLGRLDDYGTRSGYRITPVVAWAGPGLYLKPDPGEVEESYHIPLAELDSPAIPFFEAGPEPGRPVLYSRLPSLGHAMYAPTAAILYQFREVALRGLDTRVAHYDQPAFAWR